MTKRNKPVAETIRWKFFITKYNPDLTKPFPIMPYGLTDNEMQILHDLFAENEKIEQVILYGSRAKGTYKPFSDVDITIVGAGLTRLDIDRLHATLDKSPIPYMFDIFIFDTLKNENLKENVSRCGVVLYKKGE